jgi:hypothetical protein
MSSMGYPQQYPGVQAQAFNTQVIRRSLTDTEKELTRRSYRTVQNGLRGLSLFCLILFVLNTYVLSTVITDAITLDTLSTVLYVFMIVLGAVAIGMSVNAIMIRKKIVQTLADGTAVEVFAPAYRGSAGGKGQAWTIGPISMMPTRGLGRLMVEGQPTSVLCVPRLKMAIAINNYGLRQGARIMCPPNLEMMAVPAGPMPVSGSVQSPAYPAYGGPTPQTQAPQAAPGEDVPPPPPD